MFTRNVSAVRFADGHVDTIIVNCVQKYNAILCGVFAAIGVIVAITMIVMSTSAMFSIANKTRGAIAFEVCLCALIISNAPILAALNEKFGKIIISGILGACTTTILYDLYGCIYFRERMDTAIILSVIALASFIGLTLSYRMIQAMKRHVASLKS